MRLVELCAVALELQQMIPAWYISCNMAKATLLNTISANIVIYSNVHILCHGVDFVLHYVSQKEYISASSLGSTLLLKKFTDILLKYKKYNLHIAMVYAGLRLMQSLYTFSLSSPS